MGDRLCLKITHNPFTSSYLHRVNEDQNFHNRLSFYLLYPWTWLVCVNVCVLVTTDYLVTEEKSVFVMVNHFVHLLYFRAYDLDYELICDFGIVIYIVSYFSWTNGVQ